MRQNVLITGGTGLIGSRLTEVLAQNGYQVSYLSRTKDKSGEIIQYGWDLKKKIIEEEAIIKADYIINLAGSNIFDEKWTKEIKEQILSSRVNSVNLIYDKLKNTKYHVKTFVSASAIGYYGVDTGDKIMNEESPAGNDFLSKVVVKWEQAADKIQDLNIRTIKFRFGIVMTAKGGALKKILSPIKLNAGAALASGKQYVSWIHIDDLCYIILKAIEDKSIQGVYNAVAPNPVSNEELTKKVAEKIDKSILLPNVPAFVLKLILGSEKAQSVIGGNKVSSEKILKTGYKFKYPYLEEALENILNPS